MDRRDFCKGMGAVVGVAQVSLLSIREELEGEYDPSKEYEESTVFPIRNDWGVTEYSEQIQRLISRAREVLPSGTRFQLWKGFPFDYGRGVKMGWSSSPELANDKYWHNYLVSANSSGVVPYFVVGQQVA